MSEIINLESKAQSRVIWQYRNSEKFLRWVSTLPAAGIAIQTPSEAIAGLINIDSARGAQLDICGRIVGINDRPGIRSDSLRVFAYKGTAGAQAYGQAPYVGPGELGEIVPVPDYLYRLIIKSKIVRNTSSATVDDVKTAVDFILGGDYSSVVNDNQDMTMSIVLGRTPSFNIRAALEEFDIIPRPQGVKISSITFVPNQDTPGSFGGDEFAGEVF